MTKEQIKLYESNRCPFCKKKVSIYVGKSIIYNCFQGEPLKNYYECEQCKTKFVIQRKEVIINIKRVGVQK